MIKKQIISVKDSENPRPWYEIDISNTPPAITADKDDGTDSNATNTKIESIGDVNATNPSQNVVYAVTTDGKYICYPKDRNLSQDSINLRAHLAWYDSDNDEFTVIEFVQP